MVWTILAWVLIVIGAVVVAGIGFVTILALGMRRGVRD